MVIGEMRRRQRVVTDGGRLTARWLEGIVPAAHYRIAPPEKSLPADNLPAKIRPARRPTGRDGFVPVNWRPRGDFSGERSYNGETFYKAGYNLIREGHSKSAIISPRADFFYGGHLNVTPAACCTLDRTLRLCYCWCRRRLVRWVLGVKTDGAVWVRSSEARKKGTDG